MIFKYSENKELQEFGIPDMSIGLEYQEEKFYRVKGSMYAFRWGDWCFDIRTVRQRAGAQKEVYAMDSDFSVDPCTMFQRQMNHVKNVIGETPLTEFFEKWNNR